MLFVWKLIFRSRCEYDSIYASLPYMFQHHFLMKQLTLYDNAAFKCYAFILYTWKVSNNVENNALRRKWHAKNISLIYMYLFFCKWFDFSCNVFIFVWEVKVRCCSFSDPINTVWPQSRDYINIMAWTWTVCGDLFIQSVCRCKQCSDINAKRCL